MVARDPFPGNSSTSLAPCAPPAPSYIRQPTRGLEGFSPLACSALRGAGWAAADAIRQQKLNVRQNPRNAQEDGVIFAIGFLSR